MLKNLFSKLKSEKSLTVKNEEPNTQINSGLKRSLSKQQNISQKDQFQLSQKLIGQSLNPQAIINGQIKQIRYWATGQIPQIFIKVLSCPISHYNMMPHSQRKVKQIDLNKEKFPQYLNFMKPLMQRELSTYNHLLINHYPKGIGIMHHFDGPMYKDKVVVLSLGGPTVISFQENYKKESKSMQILLEDKSVNIFEQDAYQKYLHGIQNNKFDAITFSVFAFQYQDQPKENDMVIVKCQKQEIEVYKIGQSSVKNFKNIKSIHRVIEKYLQRLIFKKTSSEQQRFCFEFDQFEGYAKIKGCFIYIRPDLPEQGYQKIKETTVVPKSYKWKMEIQRQQRISITIRQQYSSQFHS